MLEWLKIRNLALVDELDISFSPGFNVITGETGAGKSVIMGAVSLLLGERADKEMIRNGTERCDIGAEILLSGNARIAIDTILTGVGIASSDGGDRLHLRRSITSTSTRNFVNDVPVTLQTLGLIGDGLIDVHGANEHQSLFQPATQLELLDRYADVEAKTKICASLHRALVEAAESRDAQLSGLPDALEAEGLRKTIEEIAKLKPMPGEDEQIAARHAIAANAKTILEIAARNVDRLNESEDSIRNQFGTIYRDILELQRFDEPGVAPIEEQCAQMITLINELNRSIEAYAGRIELDETEFLELEQRMAELQRLKRRYGPTLEAVLDTAKNAEERLRLHEDADELRRKLEKEEERLRNERLNMARELSADRKMAATRFREEVMREMRELGFLQAAFDLTFSEVPPGPTGIDRVEFLLSVNPGEPLQSLRKIASSGEISRVMLALKTVLAKADSVPILVFDEIDVNIGGETAAVVGKKLRALGDSHQVLCISHLPQVAAAAANHYRVEKLVQNNRTTTRIRHLEHEERIVEIARMLGGGTAATRHATEMLAALKPTTRPTRSAARRRKSEKPA
jgi:DNA repair protein RecN (Recombination protein N)